MESNEGQYPKGRFWDVALRDGGKCVYCGLGGSKDAGILHTFEIDHIVPRCFGGTEDSSNLALCCKGCNNDKAAYDPHGDLQGPLSREFLIERARQYVKEQCGVYYRDLVQELNRPIVSSEQHRQGTGQLACFPRHP